MIEQLCDHLDDLARIAWDHEPDWNEVYEGAEHSWCYDASVAARDPLSSRGIHCEVITGGLRGNHHTWLTQAASAPAGWRPPVGAINTITGWLFRLAEHHT